MLSTSFNHVIGLPPAAANLPRGLAARSALRLRVISLGLQALVRRSLRLHLKLEHGVEPLAHTDSARPSLGAPADFVEELVPGVVPRANAQVVVAANARVEAARRRPRPIDLLRMPAGPQADHVRVSGADRAAALQRAERRGVRLGVHKVAALQRVAQAR